MNKHVEKATKIRNEVSSKNNCAQTLMRVYADEIGMTEDTAADIGCNFGGGMKCGSVCGAITAGLMILGAKGIDQPMKINEFRKQMSEMHGGMTDCADLLRRNAANGGNKKEHCDRMIFDAIDLIDGLKLD